MIAIFLFEQFFAETQRNFERETALKAEINATKLLIKANEDLVKIYAGIYHVFVLDKNGCIARDTFEVTQTELITLELIRL